MKIAIIGGAGFVGSSLARSFRNDADYAKSDIVVLDNLKRRGSEVNLGILAELGIQFIHGDVRSRADLDELGSHIDLVIDASAEPSVVAGVNGRLDYLLQTNLIGSLNLLDYAKQHAGAMLFLSTSRVYAIESLLELKYSEAETRFELDAQQTMAGASKHGVAEPFPTDRPRSFYGTTKLASEFFFQEYHYAYKLPVIMNRCGVIAGPGQFGKVDQGVFSLWVYNTLMGRPLKYTGFGGRGKQVRDLLHPGDLFDLIKKQFQAVSSWNADVYNVGGGREISLSLCELTQMCEEVVGTKLDISGVAETTSVDVPLYLSDTRKVRETFSWKPTRGCREIVSDIAAWAKENRQTLEKLL